jgi:predicted RNase H-like HicB family nuclease
MTSQRLKVVVERHADGYVAYPLGIQGVVVGQGDTYEDALEDVRSAIAFHRDTFGPDSLHQDDPVQEVFLAETVLAG